MTGHWLSDAVWTVSTARRYSSGLEYIRPHPGVQRQAYTPQCPGADGDLNHPTLLRTVTGGALQ